MFGVLSHLMHQGSVCSQQLGPHTLKGLVREEPHWEAVMQAVQPGSQPEDQPHKVRALSSHCVLHQRPLFIVLLLFIHHYKTQL